MNFQFNPAAPPSCDVCKSAPASMQFVEQRGSVTKKVSLCSSCAAEQGIKQEGNSLTFNLPSLIAALASAAPNVEAGKIPACPNCRATEDDIRSTGKLGCSACYDRFQPLIAPLVNRLHSGAGHRGLAPGRLSAVAQKAEIEELRKRLQESVRIENYEEAARIRDSIHELERKVRAE